MRRSLTIVSAALLFILGWADSARAADGPAIDLAGGYAFSRVTNEDGVNFPGGWFGSISGGITPIVGIAGEVSGAYRSESLNVSNGGVTVTGTTNLRMYSYMAGPKFRTTSDRARVFGQLLLGGVTLSGSGTVNVAGRTISSSGSDTHFGIAPGGGVDVKLSSNLGVRVGASFQLIHSEGDWGKVLQTVVGLLWTRK